MAIASCAYAQDIEPRVYSNAPVGVNFLMVGYGYTRGGLSFDPALPVTNVSLETKSALLTYTRVLDLWGKSGKIDFLVPYTFLSGSADFAGESVTRVVNGFGDPLFRASVNLYGAPALTLKEFANYRQNWIIGASLLLSMPSGQYDKSRVVNLGANRWSVRPEMGISKAVGAWTLELTAGATLFSANRDFYRGTTLCRIRSTRVKATLFAISSEASGHPLTALTSQAADRHSTAFAATTSSRIGARAVRLQCRSTRTTPLSYTPAEAWRRVLATISI